MNYSSIDEVLSSGTSNMTVKRNNSYNDSGNDNILTPTWLVINNKNISSVDVSGNMSLNYKDSSNTVVCTVNVNYRDGASYYVWYEEGSILGAVNFFRVRWKGYTHYNYSSSSYLEIFDVFVFSTGDILVHIDTFPTSSLDGSKNLTIAGGSTYTFDFNSEKPNILFKLQSDNSYVVSYELPEFLTTKYLFRSGSDIYKYDSDTSSLLSLGSVTLDEALFQSNGVSILPSVSVLSTIPNLDILVWTDKNININLVSKGAPLPQRLLIGPINLLGHNSSGIKSLFSRFEGAVKIAFSLDSKVTWYKYNGAWVLCSSDLDGMLISDAINIDEQTWGIFCGSNTEMYIAVILDSMTQNLTNLEITI